MKSEVDWNVIRERAKKKTEDQFYVVVRDIHFSHIYHFYAVFKRCLQSCFESSNVCFGVAKFEKSGGRSFGGVTCNKNFVIFEIYFYYCSAMMIGWDVNKHSKLSQVSRRYFIFVVIIENISNGLNENTTKEQHRAFIYHNSIRCSFELALDFVSS